MNKKEYSPYGTNKGGYIKSPKNEAKGDPRSGVIKGKGDLREKRG